MGSEWWEDEGEEMHYAVHKALAEANQEVTRQAHQHHVVVPCVPEAQVVAIRPDLALTLLETALVHEGRNGVGVE
jgi:hypothetical protein